jgi:hypothetical protein
MVQLYSNLYSLQIITMKLPLLSSGLPADRRIDPLPSNAITQPWEGDGALVPLLTTADVGSAAPMDRNSISQPIMRPPSPEAFFGRFVLLLYLFF